MSHHDSELDALFAAERSYEEAPQSEARARMREAVLQTIRMPGGDDGGDGGNDDGGGGAGGGGGAPGIAVPRALLGMLATFIVGGIVGAAVMNATAPPAPVFAPPVVAFSASAAPPEVARSASSSPGIAVGDLPSASASASPATPAPSATAGASDAGPAIAAERALLDAARVALANGEPREAMELVDRHAKEFPRGRLIEEREALAIRSLVKAGRYDEARKRGAAFKAAWPHSIAIPAVTGALESIP